MVSLVSTKDAWQKIQQEDSFLLDVRTEAEWDFVGTPVVNAARYIQISFMEYPGMLVNNDFILEFNKKFTGNKQSNIFCLCRSGARSHKVAEILELQGFTAVYNLIDGFEGEVDSNQQRSNVSGWKFNGLPWRQN